MIRFIDDHRDQFGVEPLCTVLQIAPSTYHAAKTRPSSARALSDAALKPELQRIHRAHFGVYGIEKLWRQLRREGHVVGRDRVARLMCELGIRGVVRGTGKRTTLPAPATARPADLVQRQFVAAAPNQTWVADLTYVWTWAGFCYVAFITDVFSRRIVGWRVSTSLSAAVVLDALEMAIWSRRHDDLSGLVHHSDRGVQYLCIKYTERLAEIGAVPSVGSKGDSYDNALAETVNGLFKAELIHRKGPWRHAEQVELAIAGWVMWWNEERLHSACDYLPPAEFEQRYERERVA